MDLVILGKISTSLCIPLSLAMLQLHNIGHNGDVMMSPPPSMPKPSMRLHEPYEGTCCKADCAQ
jgi:hypothetical protein